MTLFGSGVGMGGGRIAGGGIEKKGLRDEGTEGLRVGRIGFVRCMTADAKSAYRGHFDPQSLSPCVPQSLTLPPHFTAFKLSIISSAIRSVRATCSGCSLVVMTFSSTMSLPGMA